MSDYKEPVGSPASVGFTGLATLASGTYVQSTNPITFNTNKPAQAALEVNVETTNTPTGNQQVLVYVRDSLDGSVFASGPTSGTSDVRQANLKYVGCVPLTTASTPETRILPLKGVLDYIPHSAYVVIKNDLGVALTAGTVRVSEIVPTIT